MTHTDSIWDGLTTPPEPVSLNTTILRLQMAALCCYLILPLSQLANIWHLRAYWPCIPVFFLGYWIGKMNALLRRISKQAAAWISILALTLLLTGCQAFATPPYHHRYHRSAAARQAFKNLYPCPSTGNSHGPCPGYVIDHRNPLACGGLDAPSNMQWQTLEAAKRKDKWERRGCSHGQRYP